MNAQGCICSGIAALACASGVLMHARCYISCYNALRIAAVGLGPALPRKKAVSNSFARAPTPSSGMLPEVGPLRRDNAIRLAQVADDISGW